MAKRLEKIEWLEDIKAAFVNLGGEAPFKKLYAEIQRIRASKFSPSWKRTIRSIIYDYSSDSNCFRRGPDLFYTRRKNSGIWGLRSSLKESLDVPDKPGPETLNRASVQSDRIQRDTELVKKLKSLHKNTCQLCNQTLRIGNGETYSEAHHIQPLGDPHDGPDVEGNIIVLCPNDHVRLDYGAIRLDPKKIRIVRGHSIERQYIQYHNQNIWVKKRN